MGEREKGKKGQGSAVSAAAVSLEAVQRRVRENILVNLAT